MKKILSILLVCMFVLAPVFAISASAAVPFDKMIGLYNMENDFKDSVSGKEGTLKNGASFTKDAARGNVLSLNNDSVISPGTGLGYDKEGQFAILADSHIPNTDAMTISLWYYAKEQRNWARVIDFGDDRANKESADPQRFINISPANAATGGYTIGTVNVNDGASIGFSVPNNRDRVFAPLAPTKEWVHVVLVIDPKGAKENILYVNGVPHKSTSGGGATDAPNPSTFSPKDILSAVTGVGPTYLGRSRYNTNGDQVFNGFVDDVAIFNVALTADQVKELSTTDLSKGDPTKAAATTTAAAAATTTKAPAGGTTTAPKTGDATLFIVLTMITAIAGSAVVVRARASK